MTGEEVKAHLLANGWVQLPSNVSDVSALFSKKVQGPAGMWGDGKRTAIVSLCGRERYLERRYDLDFRIVERDLDLRDYQGRPEEALSEVLK